VYACVYVITACFVALCVINIKPFALLKAKFFSNNNSNNKNYNNDDDDDN